MNTFNKFKSSGYKRILLAIPLLMAFVIFNAYKGKETSAVVKPAAQFTKTTLKTDTCDLSNALTTFQYLDGITHITTGIINVSTNAVPDALYYVWYQDDAYLTTTYVPYLDTEPLCGWHDLDVRAVTPCGETNRIGSPYTGAGPHCP